MAAARPAGDPNDERRRPRMSNFSSLSAGLIERGKVSAEVLYGADAAEPVAAAEPATRLNIIAAAAAKVADARRLALLAEAPVVLADPDGMTAKAALEEERTRARQMNFGALSAGMLERGKLPRHILTAAQVELLLTPHTVDLEELRPATDELAAPVDEAAVPRHRVVAPTDTVAALAGLIVRNEAGALREPRDAEPAVDADPTAALVPDEPPSFDASAEPPDETDVDDEIDDAAAMAAPEPTSDLVVEPADTVATLAGLIVRNGYEVQDERPADDAAPMPETEPPELDASAEESNDTAVEADADGEIDDEAAMAAVGATPERVDQPADAVATLAGLIVRNEDDALRRPDGVAADNTTFRPAPEGEAAARGGPQADASADALPTVDVVQPAPADAAAPSPAIAPVAEAAPRPWSRELDIVRPAVVEGIPPEAVLPAPIRRPAAVGPVAIWSAALLVAAAVGWSLLRMPDPSVAPSPAPSPRAPAAEVLAPDTPPVATAQAPRIEAAPGVEATPEMAMPATVLPAEDGGSPDVPAMTRQRPGATAEEAAPAPAQPEPPAPVAAAPAPIDVLPAPQASDAIVSAPAGSVSSLVQRGDEYLLSGDIAAARLYYERAAEAGDTQAMLALAQTYDAVLLQKSGARGIRPDPERARHWYAKAAETRAAPSVQR